MACEFLEGLDTRRFYYFRNGQVKKHNVLDLLEQKKHQEILGLVTSGAFSVKEELHPMPSSLLALTLQQARVKDLAILLDALKLKGEKLDEGDLEQACSSASPESIELLLSHGVPVGPNALHCLVDSRGMHNQQGIIKGIKLLLGANAGIDDLGSFKVTPLTTACASVFFRQDVIQCLLDSKADVLGAPGAQWPLHAHVAKWGRPAGVELLIKHRADANQQDAVGKTALHYALAGHPKFALAMHLKALGADVMLADHQGLRPSQILLKRNSPTQAAELEGRPMNAEELRVKQALDHPLAKKLRHSAFGAVSWTLNRLPESFGGYANNEHCDEFPYQNLRLSECLDGHVPKHLVLQLPLTRYSELYGDLWLKCPPDGLTLKGVLMEIYKFYQDPFSREELAEIRAHFGRGSLGDTFGYIQDNVEEPEKKQRVPRLNLRGDSIFFEGFGDCRYFEDDESLWGRMMLGS